MHVSVCVRLAHHALGMARWSCSVYNTRIINVPITGNNNSNSPTKPGVFKLDHSHCTRKCFMQRRIQWYTWYGLYSIMSSSGIFWRLGRRDLMLTCSIFFYMRRRFSCPYAACLRRKPTVHVRSILYLHCVCRFMRHWRLQGCKYCVRQIILPEIYHKNSLWL